MKIAGFFQHLPPYPGAGSLRADSIFRALASVRPSSSTIHLFTTTGSATPIEGVEIAAVAVDEIENTQSLLWRVLGEIRLGVKAAFAVFRLRPRASLLIISSPAYLTALILSLAARFRSLPYILEIRDIYPEVYWGAGLLHKESLAFATLSRFSNGMYRGAVHVIAATEGLSRHIATRADASKVSCVYNGFPEVLLKLEIEKKRRFTVCFHGVMGYFQDIETLVAVARAVEGHGIDVLVIGYGRKEKLLQNVPANLHFAGRLSFDETITAISKCHVGLCLRLNDPISHDAFPVKVWEYIGLGIPTIITPHCEAGAFVERHKCGMQLESGNVGAIVAQILNLKANGERFAELSKNCRKIAPEFTRENAGIEIARIVLRYCPV